MSRVRRKRMHHRVSDNQRKFRTRRRTKDLDQVHAQVAMIPSGKFEQLVVDEELPGLGQFYCVHCDKYFIGPEPLKEHTKSKVHKRRLKELKDKPYTQEEAEAVVGLKKDSTAKKDTLMSII